MYMGPIFPWRLAWGSYLNFSWYNNTKYKWNTRETSITKTSGRRWRDKELSMTKQNNTIAMTDTRRKNTITEEQPLNGQQLTLSSLHTSKNTFANSLDQNEMAEPLIHVRSYTASHSFIDLWQNTYFQQWMCPNSEMEEPFSETQEWKDSAYWGWMGFDPVWLARNFTRFSWSSPCDKYNTEPIQAKRNEPGHGIFFKSAYAPGQDSGDLAQAHRLSRVLAACMKSLWIIGYQLSAVWSDSSLGTQAIVWKMMWCGSNKTNK